MKINLLLLAHQTLFGAIAAAGFGVLFNVSFRLLPWCAITGALALGVRTACMELGWTLVGASFTAALVVGIVVQLMGLRTEVSQDIFGVAGCIPMVPGSIAAKAIMGLFAFTTASVVRDSQPLVTALQYALRVMFTVGAIGTGLAIPTFLTRVRLTR
jgi:uncharacterized membrane protein YjjB (DUF3815 family)